jgi:hypothetical protein
MRLLPIIASAASLTAVSAVAQNAPANLEKPTPQASQSGGEGIDNDVRVLEGLGGLLRKWGCRVVTATTPEAALAAVSELAARPDLVISDFHLGDG